MLTKVVHSDIPRSGSDVDDVAAQMATGLKGRRASYEKGSGIMVVADKAGAEFKVEITRLR